MTNPLTSFALIPAVIIGGLIVVKTNQDKTEKTYGYTGVVKEFRVTPCPSYERWQKKQDNERAGLWLGEHEHTEVRFEDGHVSVFNDRSPYPIPIGIRVRIECNAEHYITNVVLEND